MLPARQRSQPHGQYLPSKKKQMLWAIALIPERLEGLIKLEGKKKNHDSFPLL